jgi:hypothetical protein
MGGLKRPTRQHSIALRGNATVEHEAQSPWRDIGSPPVALSPYATVGRLNRPYAGGLDGFIGRAQSAQFIGGLNRVLRGGARWLLLFFFFTLVQVLEGP